MKQSANVVCRQRISFHIIAFHGHDCVQRVDPHPVPERRNLQERVESGGQLIVSEELLEAPVPMPALSTPLSPFKAQIPLEVVLTDLAVDLAVTRLFFAGIFLGQIYSQAGMKIYSKYSSEKLQYRLTTVISAKYKSTAHHPNLNSFVA